MITRRSVDSIRAALVLGIACGFDGPLRFLVAMPLVALALVIGARGLMARDSGVVRHLPGSVWTLIAVQSALGVVSRAGGGALWYEIALRLFYLLAVVLVGIAAGGRAMVRQRVLVVIIGGAVCLHLLTPIAVPHPDIDVIGWTTVAARALLAHTHPYTVQADDVYKGARDFGFVVRLYPYMPATLLVFAPFVALVGDFRYALAICLPLTLWLLRKAAASAGTDPALTDAATLAIALNSVGPFTVRSGWNEPLLMVVAALFAYAASRRRAMLSTIAVFLMPALKQYAWAPVLLWASSAERRTKWTPWIVGAAVAAATVLPFLLWNRRATLDGMLFQMRTPSHPRLTSISIVGVLASAGWPYPPIWLSALAQFLVSGVVTASGLAADAAGVLIGSSVALLVTFLLGWQAFVNYYLFVSVLLVLGAVLASSEESTA